MLCSYHMGLQRLFVSFSFRCRLLPVRKFMFSYVSLCSGLVNVVLLFCSFESVCFVSCLPSSLLNKRWLISQSLRFGLQIPLSSPHPRMRKATAITESPTKIQRPSGMGMLDGAIRISGRGRRYWTVEDLGLNQGNIAVLRRRRGQPQPRSAGMRRQRDDAVGSP